MAGQQPVGMQQGAFAARGAHRRALTLHRTRPHDPVQLTEAEDALAGALEALGTLASEPDEPSTPRRGARARLESFDDPRASALRHRVVEGLRELGA